MDVTRRRFLLTGAAAAVSLTAVGACSRSTTAVPAAATPGGAPAAAGNFEVRYTDEEWKQRLTPAQYDVLREAGTEMPYSSPLNDEHRRGVFGCAGCALGLYSSDTKFDSGTGWPSFWKVLD